MNPKEPTIQEFPIVHFRGKDYPLILKVGQLLRLKAQGINLMEQPPDDPAVKPHTEAVEALMEALAQGKPEEELAPMRAKVDELLDKITPERRAWKPPLARTSDPLAITELALKIVAESLRPHHKNIDYMDLADEIDVTQAVGIVTKAFDVAKNLFANRDGQAIPAKSTPGHQ